jgi:ketosteroid isomerase-like protein
MSNTETVRGLYKKFAEGDVPSVLAAFADDIEWIEAEGTPYGGTYRNAEQIVQNVFMKLATEWTGYTVTPDQFHDAGETVIVTGAYSGNYNATGKKMSTPFAHFWTLSGGKVAKFVQYTDTAVMNRALGA